MLINDASITGSLIVNASASFQHIIVSGNIIPDTNSTRNLGSTDRYFKEIYVSTSSINFVDNGNVIAVLNAGTINAIQTTTASANTRLDAIESFTSSLNNTYTTDAELNASSSILTSNINTKLNSSSFNTFTASVSATNTFTSSATARLNALETTSASVDTLNTTQNTRLGSLETISASNISRISSLETKSASVDTTNTTQNARLSALETTSASVDTLNTTQNTRLGNLEAHSASVDTLNTTQNTRLTNLEIKTGSLATTGSNLFIGSQTITGSLYISADLVVQGTSSIQNITGSSINIGTNIVNLNTATPAVRYAGLTVQDSGSSAGVTGSILWDSLCNRWIYSNPSNVGYSGGIIMNGPRAATFGNETTLTCNYVAKSGGGDHLYDSCIWEMSGSVGINTNSPSYTIDVSGCARINGGNFVLEKYHLSGNPILDFKQTNDSYTWTKARIITTDGQDSNWYGGGISFYTNAGGTPPNSITERMRIHDNGIACFSCQICTSGLQTSNTITISKDANVDNRYLQFCNTQTGGYRWDLITQSTAQGCGFGIYNNTLNDYALKFTAANLALFSYGVCVPSIISSGTICSTGNNCIGGNLYVNGCIGIGNATPGRQFSIKGSGEAWSENITTATNTQCWLYGQDGVRKGFEVYDLNTSSTRFFIAPTNGYIGIGASSPAYNLHICSTSGNTILGVQDTGVGGASRLYLVNASRSMFLTNNASDCLLSLYYAGGNRLQFNLTNQWFNTGNVGIGTESPASLLHINNCIGSTDDTIQITNTYSGGIVQIGFQQNDSDGLHHRAYIVGKKDPNGTYHGQLGFKVRAGSGSGVEVLTIRSNGNIVPGANGTQDFGSSSLRWSTVYTSDLDLSNGIGDYTIVEGENDLFLYNNKQCKVYRFMLEQVCAYCATPKKS